MKHATDLLVKFCGFTNEEDALSAVDCGVSLLGFVFHEKSPRYVSPARARQIISSVRLAYYNQSLRFVAVMVFDDSRAAADTFLATGCDILQWHGSPDTLPIDAPTFLVWRPAPGVSFPEPLPRCVSHVLFDTYDPELHGGTGRTADWNKAAALANKCSLILSGGLSPGNIAAAIQAVHPAGVDVASGIESRPGKKDLAKMRDFITAVRTSSHV